MDHDGQEGGPYCLGNVANVPVEVLESENPVRVEAYGLLPDTEGPGRYRGCLGAVREYRLLADEAVVQVRSDRQRFQPWGVFGGRSSLPPRLLLRSNGQVEILPSKFVRRFRKDDVLRVELAGGGGYGPALERDPERVREDVRQEKITVAHARDAYGVVVDPETLKVDAVETAAVRRAMANAGSGAMRGDRKPEAGARPLDPSAPPVGRLCPHPPSGTEWAASRRNLHGKSG